MASLKFLSFVLIAVSLTACGPSDSGPITIEQTKANLTGFGEKVQSAADGMEKFGDGVTETAQYAGDKIEALGNLVIEATGGGPQKHTD